jgi:hypothetical protein
MVSYVWIRYKMHTRSAEYRQFLEGDIETTTEESHYSEKVLAA